MTPLLRPIIAQINGLATEIKRTKASTKFHNHSIKQWTLADLKLRARHTMLAYAFIKRIPYSIVENKCNEKPSAFHLVRIITGLGIGRKYLKWYYSAAWEFRQEELNKEVGEWLNPPQPSLIQSTISSIKTYLGCQ